MAATVARSINGAAALALLVTACSSESTAKPEDSSANSSGVAVDVLSASTVQFGGAPWGVTVDGDDVWVSDASRATIWRVDASTGTAVAEIETGAPDPRDSGVATVDGQLWVANLGGTVGLLDTRTGTILGRFLTGGGEPASVALDDRWAWVATHGPDGGLVRFDRQRPSSTPLVVALPESGFDVAVAGQWVWVAGLDGRVFAVDAADGSIVHDIEVGGSPRGITVANGDVWVALRDAAEVVRIDGASGEETIRVATNGQPWPIAADAGAVWVATLEGQLLRIDADTAEITASGDIPQNARGIAVDGRAVWVTSQTGSLTRVDIGAPI